MLLDLLRFWWKPTSYNAYVISIEAFWKMDDEALKDSVKFICELQRFRCVLQEAADG